MARDSVMLNVPIAFDHKRLLNFTQVLRNYKGEEEISFKWVYEKLMTFVCKLDAKLFYLCVPDVSLNIMTKIYWF